MKRLLVTIDSLRYDYTHTVLREMDLPMKHHDRGYATSVATPGSFQSLLGGYYPTEIGLEMGDSIAEEIDDYSVGITSNHLLTPEYGYHLGFDEFTSPEDTGVSLSERIGARITQGSSVYHLLRKIYNLAQGAIDYAPYNQSKSYRKADEIIAEFRSEIRENGPGIYGDWFGWLHFMEPHHPYDPDSVDRPRGEMQRLSRNVVSGAEVSDEEREEVRRLYESEVRDVLSSIIEMVRWLPSDTRVIVTGDHGELLGEYGGKWGHPGLLVPELLHVPVLTLNCPDVGKVISGVDIPSMLLGEEWRDGSFDREYAYASYGGKKAVLNEQCIFTGDGNWHAMGEGKCPGEAETEMKKRFKEFGGTDIRKEDADMEHLKHLGYR